MGRPKGSKNKPKGKPVEAVKAPEALVKAVESIPAPAPMETGTAHPEVVKATTEAILAIAREYGAPEVVPDHVARAINSISLAVTREEVIQLRARAERKMLVHTLGQWANGKIPGKESEQSIQKKVQQALSLAKMFEDKGESDKARAQEERAQKIRTDWEAKKVDNESST